VRPIACRIDSVVLLMMIVMMIVVIFHRLTPEIVGIGVNRTDVVLIMKPGASGEASRRQCFGSCTRGKGQRVHGWQLDLPFMGG
jgi:hypothetical protein